MWTVKKKSFLGIDTSRSAIVFALFHLAQNQDVQEQLYSEIREHDQVNRQMLSTDQFAQEFQTTNRKIAEQTLNVVKQNWQGY